MTHAKTLLIKGNLTAIDCLTSRTKIGIVTNHNAPMTTYTGPLAKMNTELASPTRYTLPLGDEMIDVNGLIGRILSMRFTGRIRCFCGELKTKVYRQNFCYNCFWEKPQAGDPIFHPEKSQAHLGIEDRDLEWEKANQLQPHIVYLAVSSGLKVGVTRKRQVPTRWIDQGASYAIRLAETPNRYLAGAIEVALKEHLKDKTVWQRMLKNEVPDLDLRSEKRRVANLLDVELGQYVTEDDSITDIEYPVKVFPTKTKSLNLQKVETFEGELTGIKGQYLIFGDQAVFNVRNNEGLIIDLNVQ